MAPLVAIQDSRASPILINSIKCFSFLKSNLGTYLKVNLKGLVSILNFRFSKQVSISPFKSPISIWNLSEILPWLLEYCFNRLTIIWETWLIISSWLFCRFKSSSGVKIFSFCRESKNLSESCWYNSSLDKIFSSSVFFNFSFKTRNSK